MPVPPRSASAPRPRRALRVLSPALAALALLAPLPAGAQAVPPDPGAEPTTLFEPFARASASLGGGAPARFVQTIHVDSALGGRTSRSLSSTATDLAARAVRTRSCLDGRLDSEFVYRDGELVGFLLFGSTVEVVDGSSAGFDALAGTFEATLELYGGDPDAFGALGFLPEATRSVGRVDYGLVEGEGVLFRYPAGNPFALGEGTAVISEEGLLTGMTAAAGALGELLLRVDGYLALPSGLVPRGFTNYRLVEARAHAAGGPRPTPLGTTRFTYRFPDGSFDADLFDPAAVEAELRERLGAAGLEGARGRLQALRERLADPALAGAELDAVLAEIELLRVRLGPAGDVAPPCPGPL